MTAFYEMSKFCSKVIIISIFEIYLSWIFAQKWNFRIAHFWANISIKPPIFKISQKYSLTSFAHMLWISGKYFSSFEPKLYWDILKLHFCLEIYERPYQIFEIEIVITFEGNWILILCKKQWFRLIEIFENKQTSFFDPWPPLHS